MSCAVALCSRMGERAFAQPFMATPLMFVAAAALTLALNVASPPLLIAVGAAASAASAAVFFRHRP